MLHSDWIKITLRPCQFNMMMNISCALGNYFTWHFSAHFKINLWRIENKPDLWYWALIPEAGNQLKNKSKSKCFICWYIHICLPHSTNPSYDFTLFEEWNWNIFYIWKIHHHTKETLDMWCISLVFEQKIKARRIRSFYLLSIGLNVFDAYKCRQRQTPMA